MARKAERAHKVLSYCRAVQELKIDSAPLLLYTGFPKAAGSLRFHAPCRMWPVHHTKYVSLVSEIPSARESVDGQIRPDILHAFG
eukprot:scaffold348064_cov18-Prasinocladus_malaysianus.AAC.1